MKHFVTLISAALLTMTTASATVSLKNISPERFQFGNYEAGTAFTWDETTTGAPNHRVPKAATAEEITDNGLLCAFFNVKVPATEVVKHSEEAGVALKVYQADSNVGFGVFQFFPKNASSYTGTIRATIIYRIEGTYSGSGNHAIEVFPFKSTQFASESAAHSANASNELIKADSSVDPTKWAKTTIDFTNANGVEYKVNFNLNQGATIYIKEVRIQEITYDSADELNTAGTTEEIDVTNIAWNETTTGIADVAEDATVAYSINGNAVTFGENATIYTISGAQAATAVAGEAVELNAGFYVANVGGKAVKFAIK